MKKTNGYPITFWHGVNKPYICDENGKLDISRLYEMKEAGFNLVACEYSKDINKMFLKAAEEVGILVTLADTRTIESVKDTVNRRRLLEEVVADYKDYPALHSYYVTDEPNSSMFEDLGDIVRILHELDPEHEAYINIFPNYAANVQLGNDSYREHVEDYLNTVKPSILSYDHYHFLRKGATQDMPLDGFKDERERRIYEDACNKVSRAGFFDNIEIIREMSEKYDIPFMVIVLLVAHGPYRYLHEGEIRWEVFQSLAYGSSRISYFTYWTPVIPNDKFWFYREALISADGKRTEHYDIVSALNKEVAKIGAIIQDKKSLAVFHTNEAPEPETKLFKSFGGIEKVEGGDATLGFFEGDYLLVANRSFESNTELTLYTDRTLEIYDSYEDEWIILEATDNKYTLTLEAGDGILVKLVNHIKYK